MKIAFIVGEFPTLSETFILNQITGLIDLGHDVQIFVQKGNFNGKTHPDVLIYNLKKRTHYFNIPSNRVIRIIKAIYLIITNFYKSPSKILESLNIFKYGTNALSLNLLYITLSFLDKNFDIIFCHFGPIGNIGACLKQIGITGKLITIFHGDDIRLGIIKGKNYYKKLFEVGDCFLAISKYNYKNLIHFGADSKKIIFHSVGIDVKKFSKQLLNPIKKGSKIRIITVARLVEEKGLEYGIKAIRVLLNNNPKINLEYGIIGEGPLEIPLKKLVRKLVLTNIIHFLGPMTQEEIIKEMEKSNIFLLPSIAEALPVVLMEAQAMKLPVITTNVGGIPEVIVDGKSGFLVPANDIKTMAKKIEYLIKNPEIRFKMGRYGQRYSKKFNIYNLNKKLINIFCNLLKENIN